MPAPLDEEEVSRLRSLGRVFDVLRGLDPEMPAQQAATLLLVATNPGISVKGIRERLSIAGSSASRNVAALSEVHRLGQPGLNLVVSVDDPRDRRFKSVQLTSKGKKVVTDILNALD